MDNAQPYTFSWNNIKTHEGITYPIDTLDRARYASFLTNFLIAEANNGGYVLNINAPWGTGKTYFLNRWLIDLKEKHPVVYIDAWKQDFSNDPMLSVVSSIISQLKEFQPIEAKTIGSTAGKVGGFIKDIAPIVAKGVMRKATGIDLNEDGEYELSKADEAMLGDIAAKVTDKMIKNHNATLNSITTFKNAIQDWIGAIQGNKKLKVPAFIFIDELDRCRPTYAVQMLEVIKHFFEMDNIIFVVATDTEQLQHAIKAVYGQEFDAQTYLGRFFHRRCTLQSVSKEHFINNYLARTSITKIFDLCERKLWPKLRNEKDLGTLIVELDCLYNFSLRDLEQLIDKVISIILVAETGVNLIFLIYLFMVHERDKNLFNSLMSKTSFNDLIYTEDGINFIEDIKVCTFNFQASYVCPLKDVGNNMQLTLKDILTESYNSFDLSPKQRKDKILSIYDSNDLSHIFNIPNSSDNKREDLIKGIYENSFKIEGYKNWVELAVSFDA